MTLRGTRPGPGAQKTNILKDFQPDAVGYAIRSLLAPMNSRWARRADARGFTLIEVVVALGILASVLLFGGAYLHTIFRREIIKTAARNLYSIVLSARMEAVHRDTTVVVHFDLPRREIRSWVDSFPSDLKHHPSEKVLVRRPLPAGVHFRSLSGPVNGPTAVAFDQYNGDSTLVDRIVFRSDGSLVIPQSPASRPPARPHDFNRNVPSSSVDCPEDGCRGVYVSDRATLAAAGNLFRISVDDFGRVGKASLLKWLPPEQGGNFGERDFVPPPWKWVD